MTDRIANPWGERTPFWPGEDWPVRVDHFLEEGVSEDEVDRWVQTASLHHANGDAIDLAVKDDRPFFMPSFTNVLEGRFPELPLFRFLGSSRSPSLRVHYLRFLIPLTAYSNTLGLCWPWFV